MGPSSPFSLPTPTLPPAFCAATLDLTGEVSDDDILSVVFSPDGAKIVSGGYPGIIKIWDSGARSRASNRRLLGPRGRRSLACLAVTLDLKMESHAHSCWINSLAFSPDGTKIVSGSDDRAIKVWDAGAFCASNRLSLGDAETLSPLLCSHTGARERASRRARRPRARRRLCQGWIEYRVGQHRRGGESLGFWCAWASSLLLLGRTVRAFPWQVHSR